MNQSRKEIEDKIRSELFEASWPDLQPHAERGAIILVNEDLDLIDVAYRVTTDDVEAISRWLSDESLARPSASAIAAWEAAGAEKAFRFVIVQPYVLIQARSH